MLTCLWTTPLEHLSVRPWLEAAAGPPAAAGRISRMVYICSSHFQTASSRTQHYNQRVRPQTRGLCTCEASRTDSRIGSMPAGRGNLMREAVDCRFVTVTEPHPEQVPSLCVPTHLATPRAPACPTPQIDTQSRECAFAQRERCSEADDKRVHVGKTMPAVNAIGWGGGGM